MDRHSEPCLDADVACERCGYNLRGLCGDPVRCPECGQTITWAEIQSGNSRERRLRTLVSQVEFGPNLCAASGASLILFAGLRFLIPISIGDAKPSYFAAGLAAIWGLGVIDYVRKSAGYSSRWSAFARHQAIGFPGAAVLLAVVAVAASVVFKSAPEAPVGLWLLAIPVISKLGVGRAARRHIEALLRARSMSVRGEDSD